MARQGNCLKDVKAEKLAKKRKMRRRKRALFLIIELVIMALLVTAIYFMTKYGKFPGLDFFLDIQAWIM